MKNKWLILLLLIGAVLVVGCIENRENSNGAPESKLILIYHDIETEMDIHRFHDDGKNATCYITTASRAKWQSSGGGISCLSDSQLK